MIDGIERYVSNGRMGVVGDGARGSRNHALYPLRRLIREYVFVY